MPEITGEGRREVTRTHPTPRPGEETFAWGFASPLFENLPILACVKDVNDFRFMNINRAGEELLGFSKSELIGKTDFDIFPKSEAELNAAQDRSAVADRSMLDIPHQSLHTRYLGQRIVHTRKIPICCPNEGPKFLLIISEDVTDRVRNESDRLRLVREQITLEEREMAARRTSFLSEATAVLSASLDYNQTLIRLARTALPFLGDWCIVTIAGDKGKLNHIALAHLRPELEDAIQEVLTYHQEIRDVSTGIGYVLSTGQSMLANHIEEDEVRAVAQSPRHLELLLALEIRSSIQVPVIARGTIHGVISLVSSNPHRQYSPDDLELAEELGRRAGSAIDNALLYKEAQRAIRVRDEFLSIASHELKTPITSLKLLLQMTNRGIDPGRRMQPSPERLGQMIRDSLTQVDRLTALIEDLLDVSRIEAGRLSFNFELVDLTALTKETIDKYSEYLESAGNKISLSLECGLMASCDRFRIEQALLNLISNASKYGAGKPIEVIVRRQSDKAEIIVRDHGIGIDASEQERIFERFERAVVPGSISGLGLGLFITREIIRAHRGKISVVSSKGEGAIFIIELPLAQSPATREH